MKMDILLGLQWGDEGKGKIVDFLAPQYDMVARFQGGPNAGHTLFFNNEKHILRQIPSGIFRPQAKNLIGNGVVLDLITLREEIENLQKKGVDVQKNLFISKRAQVIMPTHRLIDAALEQEKGEKKIGSTLKGIGPAYSDKTARHGLRMGDIFSPNFSEKYEELKSRHIYYLTYRQFPIDIAQAEKDFRDAIDFLGDFQFVDSEYFINDEIKNGSRVLAEGAQGSLLDIDFGFYPFVTSSNTTVAGACTGLGVPPHQVGEVMGITKAYATRVGGGPFPTELHDEVGEKLRKTGQEFGAVTGRPRRCGWLDLPALKYALMINGTTKLFMMKADVLNDFDEIKVCVKYKLSDGSTTDRLPYDLMTTAVEPIYETFKGWKCDLKNLNSFSQLPTQLADYLAFVENYLGLPIKLLSYGADREATLIA